MLSSFVLYLTAWKEYRITYIQDNVHKTYKEDKTMTQLSRDQYIQGRLINGYDYRNQAWVIDGKYERCGHPETMDCNCYGKDHEGEDTKRGDLTGG